MGKIIAMKTTKFFGVKGSSKSILMSEAGSISLLIAAKNNTPAIR